MPTKGYRKGTSDNLIPAPCSARTHLPTDVFEALQEEATDRSMTMSKMMRAIITAHVEGERAQLPHRTGETSAALRELARLGNNLNQIARQANLMNLHLLEKEARSTIDTINALALHIATA